jgi:hypothetical protein
LPCGYTALDIDTFAMDNSGTSKELVGRTYSNRESKCSYQNDFSFTPCMKIWGAIFPNHHSTILPQISSSD